MMVETGIEFPLGEAVRNSTLVIPRGGAFVAAEWAKRWPSEEVRSVRKLQA